MLSLEQIGVAARLGHEIRVSDEGFVSCSCGWPDARETSYTLTPDYVLRPEDFDEHARSQILTALPEGEMRGTPAVWIIGFFFFVFGLAVGLGLGWLRWR